MSEMSRAEKRRLLRQVGQKRSEAKTGRRPAIRNVPALKIQDEEHERVFRLPLGFQVVRNKLHTPKGS